MKKIIYLMTSASCLLGAQLARAQGTGYVLDPSFGTAGKVLTSVAATPPTSTDVLLDIEVQPANKLLALAIGSNGLVKLLYNADGSLDTSYGTAGRLALANLPAGITLGSYATMNIGYNNLAYNLLPDGRVLVRGRQTTTGNDVLVLYAADGTIAPGFGTNGVLAIGTAVSGYVLQPDGKVLVASSTPVTTSVGSFSGGQMKLVRLLPDGTVDFTTLLTHLLIAPSTAAGRQAIVVNTALALQPDGKILAVGTGTERNSSNEFIVLARLLADGTPDASFGTGGTNILYYQDVAVTSGRGAKLADGNQGIMPLPGGKFLLNITSTRFGVLGFTAAGQIDAAYGTQGLATFPSSQVTNVGYTYLQADGSVLAGGSAARMLAARLSSQGVFDPTLAPSSATPDLSADFGGYATPQDQDHEVKILTLPTGELVLAGSSLRASATAAHPAGSMVALARFKASTPLATTVGTAPPVVQLYPNPLAGSELHLAGLPATTACTATVYNALGQVLITQLLPAQAGATTRTMRLPALGTGMYRLRVASAQGTATYPLVVQ
jgi:uncharacterized delta-60 repeat protein